ncbi:hypothetical protein Tco_0114465 [Tanacetum coccineum]
MPSPEQDSKWPPAHWKTAPKFKYASETKAVNTDHTRHDVTEESIESKRRRASLNDGLVENTASSDNGGFSAFSRHNRSNLFKRHEQSWRAVTPQKIIEENPASTTPLVILEQDEALKDQSESGIRIYSVF